MSLAPGAKLGPYEILSPLGAGGMGEVYVARDTRLERRVAVKVLPSHLTSSLDARQRFEREAKTISQLSHPHICALHDVGQEGGTDFLVMELLEGETLADRLTKGPLAPGEVLRIGAEIADGLEAAHRRGVVHRDLKPGNVMLTKSGAKLLDFGLAKLVAPSSHASLNAETSTAAIPVALTEEGTLLGTWQYMAPEQLDGRADARSDIFSLGAVLFEMATGRRAFVGSSRAALVAAILNEMPPPVSSVEPAIPPAFDHLVEICLAKIPEDRWQAAHDVGLQLRTMRGHGAPGATPGPTRPRLRAHGGTLIASTVAAVAIIAAVVLWLRPAAAPAVAPAPIRFEIPSPPGGEFVYSWETVSFAVSPDGTHVAYVATDTTRTARVWLRPLSSLDARPLDGTEDASTVFWSPDSRSIGFVAGPQLKRFDLAGGRAVPVCEVPEGIGLRATWGSAGTILYAAIEGASILRVPTAGGTPEVVLTPDLARGETRVTWPAFLPDGVRFLYLGRTKDGGGSLMLAEPGKAPRAIMSVVSNVQYVDQGFLLFARDSTLLGQRFDASTGAVSGEPFAVADPVRYLRSTGATSVSASHQGVLVFQSHRNQAHVSWIDRTGREVGRVAGSADYIGVRLSPDGRRALVDRAQPGPGTWDLWTIDLERGVESRVTSEATSEMSGVWLPGGDDVFYSADRGGPPHMFRRDLGSGADVELRSSRRFQRPVDVSRDGRVLAFIERSPRGNFDLWAMPLTRDPEPRLVLQSNFDENDARFSPDGRNLAFVSDESGQYEVYVMPYPPAGGKTRVSVEGGRLPRWSRDGRELYYVSDDRHLMAVPMSGASRLEPGKPVEVLSLFGKPWFDFDVSADGRRFLAIVPEVVATERPLAVVLNWTAGIGR